VTIRSDITVDWSQSPRIIEVAAPSTSLIVQDLYDTLRSLADDPAAMDDDEIVDAGGKEYLDATRNVVITVMLKNAKVKFEDRVAWITCTITGNLVALDANEQPMSPIEPAAYVAIDRALDSSGAVMNLATMETALAFIKQIEQGRWKIDPVTKQMTFFCIDKITPMITFNLKNASGNPTTTDVFERIPV